MGLAGRERKLLTQQRRRLKPVKPGHIHNGLFIAEELEGYLINGLVPLISSLKGERPLEVFVGMELILPRRFGGIGGTNHIRRVHGTILFEPEIQLVDKAVQLITGRRVDVQVYLFVTVIIAHIQLQL